MKKIVVTSLYDHSVVEGPSGNYTTIEEESSEGIVTYEGLTTMTKTNGSGTWFLFCYGITVNRANDTWEDVNEPVALFIRDEGAASRKKRRC